jgi:NADPH:quinone reductase-like Zn-dependent oxidoreductase
MRTKTPGYVTHGPQAVTEVCSTRNTGLVRSIGATHVIDYTTQDFTDGRARRKVVITVA